MAGTLYERLRKTALDRPGEPALSFLDARLRATTYSFGALFDRVDELAERMVANGLGDGCSIGILLRRQEDQCLHYLAALARGVVPAVLTPPNRKLNRAYYEETMAAVLQRAGFHVVVSDVDGIVLDVPTVTPFTFEAVSGSGGITTGIRPLANGLDASFVQYSSGTTGVKRAVVVSDDAVLAQLDVYGSAIDLGSDDVVLSWLPLYHDMGFIACLNLPLAHGVHSVMLDPIDWVVDPSLFLRAASAHRATLAWNPNFAFAFMAQRVRDADVADVDLSSLRGLVNCSEPVTFASQRQFAERFAGNRLAPDVFKGCYAMAETTFALTHGDASDPAYLDERGPVDGTRNASPGPQVSVGRPLPGVDLRVVDRAARPVADRVLGEIWVRSPFNFSGYHNDPDATREAIVDGWYRTGDLGYRVGEACFVAGRRKDLLIVGGVNVFPQDIEDLVSKVDGVVPGRVAAFARFDPRVQTERVVVLAESPLEGRPARQAVMQARQRILAAFQIANFEVHLVPPEWLVKSSSGKMARNANRSKWAATAGAG